MSRFSLPNGTCRHGLALAIGLALNSPWTLAQSADPADQPAEGVTRLGDTEVVSNQLGTITEGSGSYTPGTIATATRLVLTPRETPQTVTVTTRQQMDDFALTSIDEVMRRTPGITVSTLDSERTQYFARGFVINNYLYDGVPFIRNSAYASGNNLADTAIYDRIEVLKGASGLLTGAGTPGASLNFIRKKPTRDFSGHLSLGAGSWDNYRTEADVGGSLNESGSLRGRAVTAYNDKHSFQDNYERKSGVFYGILEADLDENTLLTVGADYQDNDPRGSSWAAIPLFDSQGNEQRLSRSFNPGARWSRWEQYTRTLFSTLEHQFDNGWVGRLQLNHQINGYDAALGSASGGNPNPVDGSGVFLYAGRYRGETKSDSADAYVSGPFQLFGREHELVFGLNATRAHWTGRGGFTGGQVANFYTWKGDIPEPDWNYTSRNDETTRQTGGYLAARFKPTDDLTLIVGSRVANYRLSGDDSARTTGKLVPYLGAVYDLDRNYSLYASYSSIFNPQTSRDRNDSRLAPEEGENYEIGLKGEFYEGRLNASLAYFEVHQDNRAEPDTAYNSAPTNPNVSYAYQGTQAKTKGFEAELSGELAPGWQLTAGYVHKVIRDPDGSKLSTWEPEDQVSFSTTYRLPGQWNRLTVGGSTRWQGKGWQEVNNPVRGAEDYEQDSYWLVDLMTRYQMTDQLSATVNLNNLFDKKYYTNVGFYDSVYYGDPRNLMVTARYDF